MPVPCLAALVSSNPSDCTLFTGQLLQDTAKLCNLGTASQTMGSGYLGMWMGLVLYTAILRLTRILGNDCPGLGSVARLCSLYLGSECRCDGVVHSHNKELVKGHIMLQSR